MTSVAIADSRPYHHGDLRRALVLAAEAVLEREGPNALSLRAVAREAGVSPAAPYHHFKDKNELLNAVAIEGFAQLKRAMADAINQVAPDDKRSAIGIAYVEFSQANPALYRVMYDCARDGDGLPGDTDEFEASEHGYDLVKGVIAEAADGQLSDLDLELTVIASWCAAHGLAEMCTFAKFQPLKDALGGERAFLQAVLDHLGVLSRIKNV